MYETYLLCFLYGEKSKIFPGYSKAVLKNTLYVLKPHFKALILKIITLYVLLQIQKFRPTPKMLWEN